VDIKSETEFSAEEAEHGYEEEEVGGRCAAILANGRRCPNAALPGSRYCGLDSHQALAQQEGDQLAPTADAGSTGDGAATAAEADARPADARPIDAPSAEAESTSPSIQSAPSDPAPIEAGSGQPATAEAPAAEADEGAPS
jgi:N utilization substance protein A